MDAIIRNERHLLRIICQNPKPNRAYAKRVLYKYTDCGAWIDFKPDHAIVGSIVEGCDFGTATYIIRYGECTEEGFWKRIGAIEREASDIWNWANVLRDRTGRRNPNGKTLADMGYDAPDTSYEYGEFEQGERSC